MFTPNLYYISLLPLLYSNSFSFSFRFFIRSDSRVKIFFFFSFVFYIHTHGFKNFPMMRLAFYFVSSSQKMSTKKFDKFNAHHISQFAFDLNSFYDDSSI